MIFVQEKHLIIFFQPKNPSFHMTPPTSPPFGNGLFFPQAFGSPTHSGRSDLGINTLGTLGRVEEFDQGGILPEAKLDSVMDGFMDGMMDGFYLFFYW